MRKWYSTNFAISHDKNCKKGFCGFVSSHRFAWISNQQIRRVLRKIETVNEWIFNWLDYFFLLLNSCFTFTNTINHQTLSALFARWTLRDRIMRNENLRSKTPETHCVGRQSSPIERRIKSLNHDIVWESDRGRQRLSGVIYDDGNSNWMWNVLRDSLWSVGWCCDFQLWRLCVWEHFDLWGVCLHVNFTPWLANSFFHSWVIF